jgi:hypothetical protein
MVAILLALKLAVKHVMRLVMINVVHRVSQIAVTIALPHVERAMVSVLPDVGTLVKVLRMPILLSVELVTMVVHILQLQTVITVRGVHGVAQNVKTIVHLIAA